MDVARMHWNGSWLPRCRALLKLVEFFLHLSGAIGIWEKEGKRTVAASSLALDIANTLKEGEGITLSITVTSSKLCSDLVQWA